MIINVRGTNGSGKSTVVKEVMLRCSSQRPEYQTGRMRPIGYRCARPDGRVLFVPGHYETACGGCDTITSPAEVYALIEREAAKGNDVLFEGIIAQDSMPRLFKLAERYDVTVIGLQVPIEECLTAVGERRTRRGNKKPLDPTNTVERLKGIRNQMNKLAEMKIRSFWMPREMALNYCVMALGIPNHRRQESLIGGLF